MLYLKEDGTFGDTHEAQHIEYEVEEAVDRYFDESGFYSCFMDECSPETDGFEHPQASFFYDDLIEWVEEEYGINLTDEAKKELCEEWDKYYNEWIDDNWSDLCDEVAEHHDDDGWPY